jgi:hypothetical protein
MRKKRKPSCTHGQGHLVVAAAGLRGMLQTVALRRQPTHFAGEDDFRQVQVHPRVTLQEIAIVGFAVFKLNQDSMPLRRLDQGQRQHGGEAATKRRGRWLMI